MNPKQQARHVLDRLRLQIEARLPEPSGYGAELKKLELGELAAVSEVVRDYLTAEREWHEIPDPEGWEAGQQGE